MSLTNPSTALLAERPRQPAVHQRFGLVTAVSNEVKDIAHLPQLAGKGSGSDRP